MVAPILPSLIPGLTILIAFIIDSYVVLIKFFVFIETSPTKNILLVSPWCPSTIAVTSIFKISRSLRTFSEGIP